jgi:hypothetical protein
MVEARAAFVRGLQEAAGAPRGTGSTSAVTALPHHSTSESKAHRSIFSPLLYFLQLGYEGQKALRKALSRRNINS